MKQITQFSKRGDLNLQLGIGKMRFAFLFLNGSEENKIHSYGVIKYSCGDQIGNIISSMSSQEEPDEFVIK